MMDQFERLNELVDGLLTDRRLKRSRLSSADELEALQMASALRASRAGTDEPSPDFVAALHLRLLEEQAAPAMQRTFGLLSRRRLFGSLAASLATGLAAGIGLDRWLAPKPVAPAARRWRDPIVGDNGQWVRVASVSNMPAGATQKFSAGAISGYLFNEDGQFRAVSGTCTCMGCALLWNAEEDEFSCPCHGATFDRAGMMVNESAIYPGERLRRLPSVRVQVEEDIVMVWTIGPVEEPKPPPLPPIVSEADARTGTDV